jgi:hypothetical protein
LKKVANRTFAKGQQVETDDTHFSDCTFPAVTLDYRGGAHPTFERCTFESCGWHFSGPALKTIQILQQINASPGGEEFLAGIFRPGVYITD